jgi:hypothetical protein
VKNCTADLRPLITKSRRDYYSYSAGDQRPPVDTGKNLGLSLEGPDPCVPFPPANSRWSKPEYTGGLRNTRRGQSWHRRSSDPEDHRSDGVEPGHTPRPRIRSKGAHAVEFSKTVAPLRGVVLVRGAPRTDLRVLGRTGEYSARRLDRVRFLGRSRRGQPDRRGIVAANRAGRRPLVPQRSRAPRYDTT